MVYQLAEKLRELRLKAKLSQKEVAKRINVSPSIASAYETEERTPSVEVLLALASLYKCSSDYLLGLDRAISQKNLDVSGLSEEQIHALQALINTMKSK